MFSAVASIVTDDFAKPKVGLWQIWNCYTGMKFWFFRGVSESRK